MRSGQGLGEKKVWPKNEELRIIDRTQKKAEKHCFLDLKSNIWRFIENGSKNIFAIFDHKNL